MILKARSFHVATFFSAHPGRDRLRWNMKVILHTQLMSEQESFSYTHDCLKDIKLVAANITRPNDNIKAIDVKGMDMEIELSNLGTVNTMFAALFSLEFLLRQPYQAMFLKSLKWNCQSQTPSDRIIRLSKVTYDMKTKNHADRAGLVSAGEKEVCGTMPSVSKV
ncbi:hypothetical protein Tco_0162723 [Tanacetum coccineum]